VQAVTSDVCYYTAHPILLLYVFPTLTQPILRLAACQSAYWPTRHTRFNVCECRLFGTPRGCSELGKGSSSESRTLRSIISHSNCLRSLMAGMSLFCPFTPWSNRGVLLKSCAGFPVFVHIIQVKRVELSRPSENSPTQTFGL
jgi:hypothetical protein